MRTIESIDLIYRDPKVRRGRPCIVGMGLRVMDIVMEQRWGEREPAKIATLYQISMGQVYAALAYYHEHKEEIDAHIQEDGDFIKRVKAEAVGSNS